MYLDVINIRKYVLVLSLALTLAACGLANNSSVQLAAPVALKVGEGFVNPVGYYEQMPRFSWQFDENSALTSQQAYQIQVATSIDAMDSANLWDSNKQVSNQSSWIKYQGLELSSRQRVYWRVRVWDEQGRISNWSEIATIELGLLANNEWKAQWVRHPEANEFREFKKGNTTFKNKLYRPQYLRTKFSSESEIKYARLYITAKGIFKAYLNGQTISKDVMTPGWTDYSQRIETLTYDVTNLIQVGENVLAATVAEGWHTGRILSPQPRDVEPSALLAQLEIVYTDGTQHIVKTDNSWQVSINGPIRDAGNYDGETYDEHYEMPGWNTINFDSSNWNTVLVEPLDGKVSLAPKRHTAPTTKVTLSAVDIVKVTNPQPDVVVFDMGQNMLGVPELNIPVLANQLVTVRFAEALEHNTFYTANMRTAKATDYYMPAKSGVINYIPTFTFHGYRYVEISGFDQSKTPELSWVKGLVQHSDFNVHANFTSSHTKLNKLAENVVWGLRGNFLDIPTDCPQRDERLGWTGDAQVFASPSMHMADVYGFWAAWLQSVREEQAVDGRVPNFIPTKQNKHTKGASSGWGDVAVIVPWELYVLTGDKQILADNYDMMQKWLSYHQTQVKDNISHMDSFRDWLQPYPKQQDKAQRRRGDTPQNLISTAYYARVLDYISRAAKVLGNEDDAQGYAAKFSEIKIAFRREFYDEQTKAKTDNTQTSYLLPLAFNLFDGDDKHRAQQHLLAEIERAGYHLGTGFLGTPLLAPVLQEMGRSDVMFEILFKETYPSWFYSINNGATTTWERWDSYSIKDGFSKESMNSLNHYAYGAVAQWFYQGILGIKPLEPGFSHIKIEPQFNQRLTNASGSYKTPHGEVAVSWNINKDLLSMEVKVPKNTSANIVLTNTQQGSLTLNGSIANAQQLISLKAGKYQITANLLAIGE
ncbi:alpha-L-rhamnosidase [Catenovulum agarivorans]|uniref:alpha-L-rhamnosidase n=1 Tax=Catenovulum agarivorans TaxID=1172192 RepID=UPI0002E200B3|nr:alpha-L-rhamnosidase [Catenovulum agarivorans]